MKTTAIDKAGRELKPGDLIIYGHSLGRCAGLQYGKILAVKFKDDRKYNFKTREHEDIKVPHYTVQGVDGDWGHQEPKLRKKGTLQFGDRILAVYRDQVPGAILDLLDSITCPAPEQICGNCKHWKASFEAGCPCPEGRLVHRSAAGCEKFEVLKKPACQYCGGTDRVTKTIDPYDHDVYGTETDIQACPSCIADRAGDI